MNKERSKTYTNVTLQLLSTFVFILVFICGTAPAQNLPIQAEYDSLKQIHHKLFSSKNDVEKIELNQQFIRHFETALNLPASFEFGFDSLTGIAKLTAPDKRFRILNWNLPMNDGTYNYYGFIQTVNPKTKKVDIIQLIDKSTDIKNQDNSVTTPGKWLGMLYYKIVMQKGKRANQYILLGWKGIDKTTTKKIIEPLTFDAKGLPKFGASVFEINKKKPLRVIFEYSAELNMSVKYHEKENRIVFDHLSPSESSLEGQYQFYGPDMSYDAFVYKKGVWNYVPDVDARTAPDPKDKFYNKKPENSKEKDIYKPKK